MITKEEKEEAEDLIRRYDKETNEIYSKNYTCCICKTNEITMFEDNKPSAKNQQSGMWKDGTVEKIQMPYGSKLDLNRYYIAICDSCIVSLEKENLIINEKELSRTINKER